MKKKLFCIFIGIIGVLLACIYYYQVIYKNSLLQIPVLMYHSFDTDNISETTIHPDNFRNHLKALKQEGYETITIKQLLDFLEEKKPLPKKPILITMDDGYLNNYSLAYPIIKEEGAKATIFVVASSTGKQPGTLKHFTWEQAKEMYDSGFIEIQSHSYDSHFKVDTVLGEKGALGGRIHSDIKQESKDEYEARIKEDLLKSKEAIEKKVGNEVFALAYPFGEFSKTSERIAKELGYKSTFIIKDQVNYENSSPYLLRRIQVSGYDSEEDLLEKIKNSRSISKFIHKVQTKIGTVTQEVFHYEEDSSNQPIEVYVNGIPISFPDQKPYIDRNNSILVPVQVIGEALGAEVTWDHTSQTVLIQYEEKEIKFIIDQDKIHINGEEKQMANAPILTRKKVVLVPVRYVSEVLGKSVTWNENERRIYIE